MNHRVAVGSLILAVAVALLAQACGPRACTLIGCGNGLTIDFRQVSASTWQEGNWSLEMTTPSGDYATCTFELPSGSRGSGWDCDEPLNLTFSSDGTRLVEASSWHSSPDNVPRDFELTLRHEDSQVATESFSPEYTESRPNGEGCPPVCAQTSVEFSN